LDTKGYRLPTYDVWIQKGYRLPTYDAWIQKVRLPKYDIWIKKVTDSLNMMPG